MGNPLRLLQKSFYLTHSCAMSTLHVYIKLIKRFNDTHREKVPSNKTPAMTKSIIMAIWVIGTSNQLFIN